MENFVGAHLCKLRFVYVVERLSIVDIIRTAWSTVRWNVRKAQGAPAPIDFPRLLLPAVT